MWEDVLKQDKADKQWIREQAPTPIYVIVDMTDNTLLPRDTLSYFTHNITDQDPSNHVLTVFVTEIRFLKSMFQASQVINPKIKQRYRLVSTLAEALTLIEADQQRAEQS